MISRIGVEELFQKHSSHLVHAMTDGKFGGFQVQVSAFLLVLENAPDQAIDFFLRLLENLLCNFFLSAVSSFSSSIWGTGLNRQIPSLSSIAS